MRRKPAPEELAVVEDFCNTATHLHGEDVLARPDTAAAWLAAHSGQASLGQPELEALVAARETIRAFIADRTDPEAIRNVNALIQAVAGPPAIGPDGTLAIRPAVGDPAADLICAVLAALLAHGLTGQGGRLKACAAPECRWVFYDRAPSGNGLWCDMDICGSRHKMRAYRARADPS
ncbi:CGNR zinc finger domain-containing protein [Streptosporangium sp. KLBMP 9127]|nr:CGNR zinc finger domain-containing protein [Streptosporangium sp. KLBMP 9127]